MKHKKTIFALTLVVLPLLVYLPSLKHELIWDSKPMILENELLEGDFSFTAPFCSGYWGTTSQRSDGGYDYYRPLTVLSFMAEKAIWGLSPWRLRFVNLLIFIAALLALYWFLRRQTAPAGAAETAILLFALFPLHVDNINWVVGRCDLLMLLFGIVSLLLFDCFLEKKRLWLGLLALASYTLALLSKESSLFFLPLFPLHELIRRRRLSLSLYVFPLFATVGFWLVKSAAIGRSGFPIRPFPTLGENILSLLGALGYYARSLVFPFAYDMFLPLPAVQNLLYLATGAVFLFFLLLTPIIAWRRPRTELAGAWFWIASFLGGALLLIFTPIHPFSILTRYLMIPAIGWTWLVGYRLSALRPPAKKAVVLLLLIASAIAVTIHSQKYHNETAFWKSALTSYPNDGFFLAKCAGELISSGDFIRSEILLRRALTFKMKSTTAVSIALQLADIAFAKARYAESLDWLEKMRVLRLDSLHAKHRLHRLLKIHLARGDLATAEAAITEAVNFFSPEEIAKKRIKLYLDFACWEKARKTATTLNAAEAAEYSQMIANEEGVFRSLTPGNQANYFITHGNFGSAWNALPIKDAPEIPKQLQAARLAFLAGREDEAKQRIEKLTRHGESDFRILNSVGNLLFDLYRMNEALLFYQRSLHSNPRQPSLHERIRWIDGKKSSALLE